MNISSPKARETTPVTRPWFSRNVFPIDARTCCGRYVRALELTIADRLGREPTETERLRIAALAGLSLKMVLCLLAGGNGIEELKQEYAEGCESLGIEYVTSPSQISILKRALDRSKGKRK